MSLAYENLLVQQFTKEWHRGQKYIFTNKVLLLLRSTLKKNNIESTTDILKAYNRVIAQHQSDEKPALLGHEEVYIFFNNPFVQQLTTNAKSCLQQAIRNLPYVNIFLEKNIGNKSADDIFAEFFSHDDRAGKRVNMKTLKYNLKLFISSLYNDNMVEIFIANPATKTEEREDQARRAVLSLIKSAESKSIKPDLFANVTQTIIEIYLKHTTEDKNNALVNLGALASSSLASDLNHKLQEIIIIIRKENSVDQTTNRLTTAFVRLQLATKNIFKDLQKLQALVHEQRGHLTPVQLCEMLYALATKKELSATTINLLKVIFVNYTICTELLLQINYILAKNYNNATFREEYAKIQDRYLARNGNIIASWTVVGQSSLYPPAPLIQISPTETMDFILLVASIYDKQGTLLPYFNLLEEQLNNLRTLNKLLRQPLTQNSSQPPAIPTIEERYRTTTNKLQSLVNQLQQQTNIGNQSPTDISINSDNIALILAINSQLASFELILQEILAMTANGISTAVSSEELFFPGTNKLRYLSNITKIATSEQKEQNLTTLGETLYNFTVGYSPNVTGRAYVRCIEKRLHIFNVLSPLDIFFLQAQEIVEATNLNEHLEYFRQLLNTESTYKDDLLRKIENPETEKQAIISEVQKRYSSAMLEKLYNLQETIRDPRWTLFAGILNDGTNEYSFMIDILKKVSGDLFFATFCEMLKEIESAKHVTEISKLYKELEDTLTRKITGKIPKKAEQFTAENLPTIVTSVADVYKEILNKIENIINVLTSTNASVDKLKEKFVNFVKTQLLPGSSETIKFTYTNPGAQAKRIGRPSIIQQPQPGGPVLFKQVLSAKEQLKNQLIQTLLHIAEVMKIPSWHTNQISPHVAKNDSEIILDKQIQDMAAKKLVIEEITARTQKTINLNRQIGESILNTITTEAGKRHEQILNLPFSDLQLLQIMLASVPELQNNLAETPYNEEGLAFGQKIIASFADLLQNCCEPENGLLFSKNTFLLCKLIIKIHNTDQFDNNEKSSILIKESNHIISLLIADLEKILERSQQSAEPDPKKIKPLSECYALLKKTNFGIATEINESRDEPALKT